MAPEGPRPPRATTSLSAPSTTTSSGEASPTRNDKFATVYRGGVLPAITDWEQTLPTRPSSTTASGSCAILGLAPSLWPWAGARARRWLSVAA